MFWRSSTLSSTKSTRIITLIPTANAKRVPKIKSGLDKGFRALVLLKSSLVGEKVPGDPPHIA